MADVPEHIQGKIWNEAASLLEHLIDEGLVDEVARELLKFGAR